MGLKALKKKQAALANTAIARFFQVSEGTIRYHLRQDKLHPDGRAAKPMKAAAYTPIIAKWIDAYKSLDRGANIQALFEHLQDTYGYPHSYKSVLRFVRKHYPTPVMRCHRRVELPAGCLAQVDWLHNVKMSIGGAQVVLQAFVMTLAFSRAFALHPGPGPQTNLLDHLPQ